jgi:hypothetical protein
LGVLEPNTKLKFEQLMKEIQSMHTEMKEGFTTHETVFTVCDAEFTLTELQREKCVMALESAAAEFDKSFGMWKLEVDSLLSSIKLKLSKLNSFFNHDAKSGNSSKPGVLPLESTTTSPMLRGSANGPNGHRVKHSIQDFGFGQVFT